VVTVSSDAHTAAKLDLDDPNLEHGWSSWRSYSNSKLANILFTRELARRLEGTGVTANCLHPGFVRTDLGRDVTGLPGAAVQLALRLRPGPETGAKTSVYVASSPDVASISGGYFVKSKLAQPSPLARDPQAATRLWTLSAELTDFPSAP
jgi:NAD(P)-dependent dehydrogenase (short-subunit alcohol dehydrogenase family)